MDGKAMKFRFFFLILFTFSCKSDYGNLQLVAKLPIELVEASGMVFNADEHIFWMINDSGNASKVFKIALDGTLLKTLDIKGKNNDWEDLAFDDEKNLYIGDFGNNQHKRKDLKILKINKEDLLSNKKIKPEKIKFYYPEQKKYPPKKKKFFYDAEAFFYFKNYFYIFTKSEVKNNYGETHLYKIPAKKGNHKAQLIGKYKGCKQRNCAITSAAISKDFKKVALLSEGKITVFTNFKEDNFLSGSVLVKKLYFKSQKEAISFKNNNTLIISDERDLNKGGNLYEISIE